MLHNIGKVTRMEMVTVIHVDNYSSIQKIV